MATRRSKAAQLKADGRFWLTLDGKNFLGRGRVELLQRIRETGSISRAAKAKYVVRSKSGTLVASLTRRLGSGDVTMRWNGKNAAGRPV